MYFKWTTDNIDINKLSQLYREELQKNVTLVSYFNAINLLLNINDFEPFLKNLIKYSEVLLGISNLKIILKKKYEKYFREYSIKENKLVVRRVKFNENTIKTNNFEWSFYPKIDHIFINYFQQTVTNMLQHLIEREAIKRQNQKINELFNRTKSHKDALELMINEISDPIFLSNARGRILLTNQSGLELTNYSYKNIYKFLEKEVKDSYMLSKKTPILKIKDKYYKITLGFLGNNEELHITILHDISDMKKLDEMKNIFISGISHEIKTPLTSLISGIKLLLMGKLGDLNEKQKQFLSLIIKDSTYLLELLENLIYTGKEAVGEKSKLVITDVPLDQLIKNLINTYESGLNEKSITVKLNIKPITIKSDYVKVRMILSNLISNAIKYNKQNGFIKIIVKELKKDIVVNILDSGIGIPQSKIEHIFDKFTRVEETVHLKNGAGLGLYIVKKNVEKLGGSISVSSSLGNGTNFVLILPKEIKDENS